MSRGRARAVVRNLTLIQSAARKNWTAAKWFLEMVEPELYGKKETIDLQHKGLLAQVELSEEEADRCEKNWSVFFRQRGRKEMPALTIKKQQQREFVSEYCRRWSLL